MIEATTIRMIVGATPMANAAIEISALEATNTVRTVNLARMRPRLKATNVEPMAGAERIKPRAPGPRSNSFSRCTGSVVRKTPKITMNSKVAAAITARITG